MPISEYPYLPTFEKNLTMKSILLFLSVFLSANLFGQKLKISGDFKEASGFTEEYPRYEKVVVGKRKAILEMYRIIRENGIDSSSVKFYGRSRAVIFHQENIKSRKRIWIFSVLERFSEENNMYTLSIYELNSKYGVNFGRIKERDGTTRVLTSKPFNK